MIVSRARLSRARLLRARLSRARLPRARLSRTCRKTGILSRQIVGRESPDFLVGLSRLRHENFNPSSYILSEESCTVVVSSS